ncbi:MAG: hypothetical protein Q8M56_10930 [Desulfobacterales bacterium]|nr:hypothetical protein [Desulfobacterales bacterium]
MTPWYKSNLRLFREERAALAAAAPLLGMVIASPEFMLNSALSLKQESVVAHGAYGIGIPGSDEQIEYGICIFFPGRYPKDIPILLCNDPKLPIGNIDRHIMNNGSACLGVYTDIMIRWSIKPDIVNFLENFVSPFLVWQVYYDAYQEPPPWGQRSHFTEGIIEYYAELLGMNEDRSVVEFMKLLARKNQPKGHEIFPCGSDMRLRNCHMQLIYVTRTKAPWQYVVHDIETLRTIGLKEVVPVGVTGKDFLRNL